MPKYQPVSKAIPEENMLELICPPRSFGKPLRARGAEGWKKEIFYTGLFL
jgi:hypothetical protein